MEYFKSGLKTVLGAPQPGDQPSGAETVERLVERVQSSTLLEDRRDACRALKALSRKYRVEVGAQGMDTIRQVLETDRGDAEIVAYALDTLANIASPEVFEEEERPDICHESLTHIGEQFTEIFIKQSDNVTLVLGFLEEYNFGVRWGAVKLLRSLLANKPRHVQEIVLVSPMGVSKLMDLLGDSREVVRNDALILLIQLTKGNANIQKIVAFENAFDRLFDVITEEGYADGGIVVEDCLLMMLNLLRNNTSNQNFFKEGSYIQRLSPMFELPPEESEDAGWSPQRVANILCVLQVVRTLVSPSNGAQVSVGCQRTLRGAGMVEALCRQLMAAGVPVDVLAETICTVGEAMRGSHENQEYFASVLAPSAPPREAIVVLLMSMVNEKQPFQLRCAVLYCFQCFLYKNEVRQSQLVQTLLPSTSEASNLSSGQLLCGALFSHDPLSNWFSAVALSHTLIENPAQKEQLLRVMLAPPTVGQSPVSLLQQVTVLLQQSCRVQSKLGLLMLLCTWLSHCPLTVKHFLSISTSIPYLTAQAASNERDDNEELVQGLCTFLMGICVKFNDDSVPSYTKDNLHQLIAKRIGLEMFLDKLSEVSRHEQYSVAGKQPQLKPRTPQELLLDHEFCRLFKALEGMIVKAVATTVGGQDTVNGDGGGGVELSPSESGVVARYKELIRDQDRRICELEAANQALLHQNRMAAVQVDELGTALAQIRDQNMVLKAQVNAGMGGSSLENCIEKAENEKLRSDCHEKDEIIVKLKEDLMSSSVSGMSSEIGALALDNGDKEDEVARLRSELVYAEKRIQELAVDRDELTRLRLDQDDLLELLADQDLKLATFREKLKTLRQKVDEDGEDDEDNDLDMVSTKDELKREEFISGL